MIKFILNDQEIATELPPGLPLLDFIRYHQELFGTKIGCREGDCGACTILTGILQDDQVHYTSATSCLMPLGNAQGKHIVSIEGLNLVDLNPIQQAMSDEGATQCGFCTPGFVVSLAGFCLSSGEPTYQHAIASIDGNICRCTGYKSIERAAAKVSDLMKERKDEDPLSFLTRGNMLPSYFTSIKQRLIDLTNSSTKIVSSGNTLLGGGTDLYVQQHENMINANIDFIYDRRELKYITHDNGICTMGGATTVTDILESYIFKKHFVLLPRYMKLVSSTPIRNMATIAGNFINASPIGDMTIFFLSLDAIVQFNDGNSTREVPLRKLYKGYKILDKKPGEYIEKILFKVPSQDSFFNFEKVSKRTHLDIASVNSAMHLTATDNVITSASLSAGGVGPIPMFLEKASSSLVGKEYNADILEACINIAQSEISPISDARGSEEYKRLLLSQLIRIHFMTIFPNEKHS